MRRSARTSSPGSSRRSVTRRARARGEIALILLGDPGFYPRFGFEPASGYGLHNPFAGVLPDGFAIEEGDFMLLPLDERARDLPGDVR